MDQNPFECRASQEGDWAPLSAADDTQQNQATQDCADPSSHAVLAISIPRVSLEQHQVDAVVNQTAGVASGAASAVAVTIATMAEQITTHPVKTLNCEKPPDATPLSVL